MVRRVSIFSPASLAAVHLAATAAVAVVALTPTSAQSSLELNVTATVGNTCSVEVKSGGGTLSFGTLTGNQQDSTQNVLTIGCDIADTTATLHVDDGLHSLEGSGSGPKLKSIESPAAYIPYSVCVGGDACSLPENYPPFSAGPQGTDHIIHARIAGGQTFTRAGSYEDQLTVTVLFNGD